MQQKPHRRRRSRVVITLLATIFGATLISSVFIFASDMARVPESSLLASLSQVFRKEEPVCPADMVFIDSDTGGYCIDRYEESPGDKCPKQLVSGSIDTQVNLDVSSCVPESKKNATPWGYVAMHQAELLCARSGKRLPSNKEWYRAAIGTPDDPERCVYGREGQSLPDNTGSSDCVSSAGVYDMIGNMWEWVGDTVNNGVLSGMLPDEGYVSEINDQGVVTQTATTSDPVFSADYLFVDKTDTRGIFRGGYWALNDRAGIYTMNVSMSPSFQGVAVGFRCAKTAHLTQKH